MRLRALFSTGYREILATGSRRFECLRRRVQNLNNQNYLSYANYISVKGICQGFSDFFLIFFLYSRKISVIIVPGIVPNCENGRR